MGVCNAACNQDNEGIYAAAEVIYQQLSRVDQSHLFDRLSAATATAGSAAAVRTVSSDTQVTESLARPAPAASLAHDVDIQWPDDAAQLHGLSANAQPVQMLPPSQTDSIELICVLRTAENAERVVTIRQPSPSLLQAIEQHSARMR